jgi:predicted permease
MRLPFFGGRARRPFEPEPEAEVDAELAFHVEQRVRDYVARGLDPAEARAAALARFGDLGGVRTECTELLEADRRAASRRDWFDDLRQDLRFGVRSALRAPVFSLLAIVTLALGIGANAAVFGVVKSVLLDALPYADAGRVVRVHNRFIDGTRERVPLSAGTVSDIRERQRSFARLATFEGLSRDAVLTIGEEPRAVKVVWAEPALFPTLGVQAALGRLLRDEEAGKDTVYDVMITHASWQRLFGGDARIVGRAVRINDIPRTVVGVLPRGFVGPVSDAEFYFPMGLAPHMRDPVQARRRMQLGLVGRLKPGVAVDAAGRELAAIGADLAREHPQNNASLAVTAVPVRDDMVGETRTPLLVLMASAGLVLVITCANLAGALLSRTISRRKEFAVRVAIGAGRGRLVRQLLAESTVLALAGGAAGILLAVLGLRVLRGLALPALPPYADLSLDVGAVLITGALALCTGLAFGVAPAMSVSRANPQVTLRDESRGASESRGSRRLRGVLVAGQIALCVSLLAAAGLLARSLWAMTAAPLGFNPDGLLAVAVQLPRSGYTAADARIRFIEQYEERLRALPGVTAVASMGDIPTRLTSRNAFFVEGAPPSDVQPVALYSTVSSDYFRTFGIPLVSGRTFGPQERLDAPPAVIISESMARRYYPTGNAVGSRIRLDPGPDAQPFTVIGVAGDVRDDPARPEPEDVLYVSNRQAPWNGPIFVVRSQGDPSALVKAAHRELAAVDPRLPIRDAPTLRALVAERMSGRRLPVVLMTAFGTLALVLASVGVYAMFASMAAAREREFGVRIALGSSRAAIAGLVLRQGGVWMVVGLLAGAGGVAVVARALQGLLYGVEPFDPPTLAVTVLALVACGAVALMGPVRRAMRADPIRALH